jgi:hypothetical protein
MKNSLYNNCNSEFDIDDDIDFSQIYDDVNKEKADYFNDDIIELNTVDKGDDFEKNIIYTKYVVRKTGNEYTKVIKRNKIPLKIYFSYGSVPYCDIPFHYYNAEYPHYTYYTCNNILKVCNRTKASIIMTDRGTFSLITAIIIKSIHIDLLETLNIIVGDNIICTIDLKLMANLFGYSLNNELIMIPIPKNIIISKVIEQKELWDIPFDIEHTYGIPLLWLKNNEAKINIYTKEKIQYYVVMNFTIIHMDEKTVQTIEKGYTYYSMGMVSFAKINKTSEEINQMIERKNKLTNMCHISKMCIECFKSSVLNNKNKPLYQALRMTNLCEVLPKDICKLIVNYDAYCENFELIIYEELNNNKINFYRIYNNDFTIKNGMMNHTINYTSSIFGYSATIRTPPTNNIAIGYNAPANMFMNNNITNENTQNNFCRIL